MNIEALANAVIDACESLDLQHMVTGAVAFNFYGIPRATKDVDLVIESAESTAIPSIIARLGPQIEFSGQVQFDTITWGKRHIGRPREHSTLSVELFELFDDAFVLSQFHRRRRLHSGQLAREIWIPTAEDVVVQKVRWARSKDLEDARDILAVQTLDALDLVYIHRWCDEHGTRARFDELVASLPDF